MSTVRVCQRDFIVKHFASAADILIARVQALCLQWLPHDLDSSFLFIVPPGRSPVAWMMVRMTMMMVRAMRTMRVFEARSHHVAQAGPEHLES